MTDYITGASGFLGKHLMEALRQKAIHIPHAEIMDTKLKTFDSLYFLSTYGNMYSHTDDRKIVQANVSELIHLLLEAKSCGFKSFVYISTSSVELQVQTMYSRTKKAAEEILLAFIDKYDLPICIIRPYSIIGVGEQKQHLIPTLINACFTGAPVEFVPEPMHDYIDVKDVVAEILQLSNAGAKGLFKLGNTPVSNREVLKIVEEVTGGKAMVTICKNLRPYDSKDWYDKDHFGNFLKLPKKVIKVHRTPLTKTIEEMVKDYVKQT